MSLFKTLQTLRSSECFTLYQGHLDNEPLEVLELEAYLESEYLKEQAIYPYQAPEFDAKASIWAGQIVYRAGQLLLFRTHDLSALKEWFAPFDGELTASSILSADLCLRFLSSIVHQLNALDPDDPLIPLLKALATTWHYSGMGLIEATDALQFDVIVSNPCCFQLYVDRILELQHPYLKEHPNFKSTIDAILAPFHVS